MRYHERELCRNVFDGPNPMLNAIIWNRGPAQTLFLDEVPFLIPQNALTTVGSNDSFRFERSEDAVVWEYNKEFYCIVTHDAEVSCSGLLFNGWQAGNPIRLDAESVKRFDLMIDVFKEEFATQDTIQHEMLRVLLKRLIIKLTRLLKTQIPEGNLSSSEIDTVRRFNLLVELNFKTMHQVQDYASLMYKSPKTLSNLFSKYSDQSPVQIIANRLFLEAKRLLLYTESSLAEVGHELGFNEPAHFSRFFKKMSGVSPSGFRKAG